MIYRLIASTHLGQDHNVVRSPTVQAHPRAGSSATPIRTYVWLANPMDWFLMLLVCLICRFSTTMQFNLEGREGGSLCGHKRLQSKATDALSRNAVRSVGLVQVRKEHVHIPLVGGTIARDTAL